MTELRSLDIATGIVLGAPRRPRSLPATPGDPLRAFEAAVLPALRRAPCLVSFSGGRDSSAVLALATRVARREGLPDPIPATNRVAAAAAQESGWQEAVVEHLGLSDWLRCEWTDELDAVGPIAQRVLARHGLLWPFNAFFHQPLLAAATGGSLLTGIGGDELFMAAVRPYTGTGRSARRAARIVFARAPYAVRRPVLRHRGRQPLPWLTPRGARALAAAAAAHDAAEPATPSRRLAFAREQRYLAVGTASLEAIAAAENVAISHPLLDRDAWGALGAALGSRGFADRTEGMRRLFGDLLPAPALERADKATFDEVFGGPQARALASAYDGAGAPSGLVDAHAMRRHWEGPEPLPQSLFLLQAERMRELDLRPVGTVPEMEDTRVVSCLAKGQRR